MEQKKGNIKKKTSRPSENDGKHPAEKNNVGLFQCRHQRFGREEIGKKPDALTTRRVRFPLVAWEASKSKASPRK